MLFSELYRVMVKKVTFVGFRGADRPNRPPGSTPGTSGGLSGVLTGLQPGPPNIYGAPNS